MYQAIRHYLCLPWLTRNPKQTSLIAWTRKCMRTNLYNFELGKCHTFKLLIGNLSCRKSKTPKSFKIVSPNVARNNTSNKANKKSQEQEMATNKSLYTWLCILWPQSTSIYIHVVAGSSSTWFIENNNRKKVLGSLPWRTLFAPYKKQNIRLQVTRFTKWAW